MTEGKSMGKIKKAIIEQENDWTHSELLDAIYDIWVLASVHEKKHGVDGDDFRAILRTICAVCRVVTEDVLEKSKATETKPKKKNT